MISYPVPGSDEIIELSDHVLAHFLRHRQLRFWQREAGGQLFARLVPNRIVIECATGPRKSDKRSRNAYFPDRVAEREEIQEMHRLGLHFVGDWHSHPEARPHFSLRDAKSISECFKESAHELGHFVLIIVGQERPPGGIEVSLHSIKAPIVLNASTDFST